MMYSRLKTDEGTVLVAQHDSELQKIVRLVYRMDIDLEQKDQRIKELESTTLDLQSELARKKYSLTVACNRVEELEGKIEIAISALKKVDNIAYEIDNMEINNIACNALKQLGELK